MPVPSFSGTFCGNGHTIKNFYCASNGSHQGLFRYLEQEGRILDLNVSGTVMPDGSRSSVGGIVGTSRGSLSGCSFTGTVEGLVSVGGIVGENLGVISDCRAAGSVNGKHFSGGIAGYSDGTIIHRSTSRRWISMTSSASISSLPRMRTPSPTSAASRGSAWV